MESNESSPPFPVPLSEAGRLRALAEYHLLDTPQTDDFDRLANLAARLFKVPIVLISLVAENRQFFKARVGLDICETSRDVSFCAHAIVQDDILLIPDAIQDVRFSSNPLVLGPPFIRFYAGKPLIEPGGEKLGTVCLIDTEPHSYFSEDDRHNLSDLAALVMDRMETHRLDYARTVSQVRFENIAATSPDAIICGDSNGAITFWNRSAQNLFGYTSGELKETSSADLVPESWQQIYNAELSRLRRGEKSELAGQTIELSGRRKDGSEFPAEFSFSSWDEGRAISVGAIVRDITERKQNEERLFRLASLDPLTDLPNRGAWKSFLSTALEASNPMTILLLDLDGFKEVNDTLGHSAGDAVLRDVAARIKVVCKDALMQSRLGGDEFAVALRGNSSIEAQRSAGRLISEISKPYEFGGQVTQIGVSIGISLAPLNSSLPEELLGAADLALYKAKAAGKGRYEFFVPAFREVAIARRAFELELKLAFMNHEFEVFYQPLVSTRSQKIIGAEALLRWRHSDRGLLTPASFIQILSEKPSAPEVGEWVMREACLQAMKWLSKIPNFRMGVNLFEAQLRSGKLLPVVQRVLKDTGLPVSSLELEIVENTILRNDAAILNLLHELRDFGVGLALDDYGTGFASLSVLKRYPVSRLKIDQTFIRNVHMDSENAAVVNAIIYLGKSFGMDVIAEGVETQAQLDFLVKANCPEAQGYLFGKPVPAAEFESKFVEVDELL